MLTVLAVISIISLAVTVAGVVAKASAAGELVGALNDALDVTNMSGLKIFDTPYMNITGNALSMIVRFMGYAQLLIVLCAFLCLIFNAFKLWSSTIELKKFYVDTIYKCVIVMVLMNIYPTIVTRTYSFATNLGVEASGGSDIVVSSFANLAEQMKNIWEAGTNDMINQIKKGADKDGKVVISEEMLKAFTKAGMTEQQARDYAKNMNWEISKKETKKQRNARKAAQKAFKNDKQRQKYMRQSLAVVTAMSQILTGTSESAIADGQIDATEVLTQGRDALKNVFYNPYIKGTKRLSFSAMMKTAVIIGECATAGALGAKIEPDKSKQASLEDLAKSKNPQLMFKIIGAFLMNNFVYKILMIIAVGYCMIEYIVTLIEYLITASVSALLIPLFFIDATKQYTMNILKSVFSYFVKILVTTMMIFFVISMYIDLGAMIVSRRDLDSIMSLLIYGCIVVLGMVLVKNSGKVAAAVISGNPSMGLGDVVHQARGMSMAAQHAGRELRQFGQEVAKAGQAGQKTAAAFAGGYAPAFRSAHQAKKETMAGLTARRDSGEIAMTDKDIKRAGNAAARDVRNSTAKQMAGDSIVKALTGLDRVHGLDERTKVGQGYYDPESGKMEQATFAQVKKDADKKAKATADDYIDRYAKANKRMMAGDIELPEANGH